MTSAAILNRVSTTDQHTENQSAELREWAARQGLTIALELSVEDSAWTSTNGKGKEFDSARERLLEGARLGEYSVVLVWAVDRLSRRGIEDTLATLRKLTEFGCSVWSLQEPWVQSLSDSGVRELMLSMFAWIAAQESARRSERVKAGLARRKAEGKPVGGRKAGSKDRKPRDPEAYRQAAARRNLAAESG